MPSKSKPKVNKSLTRGKYDVNQPGPDRIVGAVNPEPGRVFSMTYSQQIKSPKWQRKRLEVLQRDNFACRSCGSKDDQLHVHHRVYAKGKMIWDIDNEYLITLCEHCHENLTETISQLKSMIQYYLTDVNRSFKIQGIISAVINADNCKLNVIHELTDLLRPYEVVPIDFFLYE